MNGDLDTNSNALTDGGGRPHARHTSGHINNHNLDLDESSHLLLDESQDRHQHHQPRGSVARGGAT